MTATVSLHVRIAPAIKTRAEQRARRAGITMTDYVVRTLVRAELMNDLIADVAELVADPPVGGDTRIIALHERLGELERAMTDRKEPTA